MNPPLRKGFPSLKSGHQVHRSVPAAKSPVRHFLAADVAPAQREESEQLQRERQEIDAECAQAERRGGAAEERREVRSGVAGRASET